MVDCVAASIDPSALNEVNHVNLEDDDLNSGDDVVAYSKYPSRLENLENEDTTFFSTFMNEVKQCGGSKQSLKGTKLSTKPIKMKSKGRESSRTTMFKELVTQQNDTQQRILKILEYDVSSVNQVSNFNVSAAISVVNRMVDKGLMTKGNDLWCFAMSLFEDGVKRELFLNMPDDDGRLVWLKYKYNFGN